MTAREELESIYSDVHKEAAGFRPRHSVAHLSDDELRAEIDSLNRFGWEEELYRVAAEAGETLSDVRRMTVAEIAHRVAALRDRPTPTSGFGWALVPA
jgi:hypothetical protein